MRRSPMAISNTPLAFNSDVVGMCTGRLTENIYSNPKKHNAEANTQAKMRNVIFSVVHEESIT
jgi:hypothetical protein